MAQTMTGDLAVTDLLGNVAKDQRRILDALPKGGNGWTARQVAAHLGVLEGYAERLLKGLDTTNLATCILGRWYAL